jgi:hypothetical protein
VFVFARARTEGEKVRRFQKKGRHFGIKSEGKIFVSFNENEGYATRRAFNHIQILLREDANSYVLILSGWCKNEEYSNARKSGIVIVAVLLLFVLLFTTAKLLLRYCLFISLRRRRRRGAGRRSRRRRARRWRRA